ncbi:NUDIX domain-containing protein [Granulicella rosea]|uniref:NUDIX domain-containing protein n=1 Tax=Granulicella rosea TaxID=474952 RepID=UPI003CCBAB92
MKLCRKVDESEQPLDAAIREFREETGFEPMGPFLELGSIKQGGRKIVSAWAFKGDCEPSTAISNLCQMKWPSDSGRQIAFPEVDRVGWFAIDEAERRILKGQVPLLQPLAGI